MSAFDVLAVSALLEVIPLSDPPSKVVTASDWASVISAMTSQISVSTVVGVLATLVTAGIGLVFLWWGASHRFSVPFRPASHLSKCNTPLECSNPGGPRPPAPPKREFYKERPGQKARPNCQSE